MNRVGIYNMLSSIPGSNVFPDFVPEDEPLPCITYEHLSSQRSRLIVGDTSGKSDTWRIAVVADNRGQVDTWLDALEQLDNSSTDDFQKVFILHVYDETADPQAIAFRSFIDIETYDK